MVVTFEQSARHNISEDLDRHQRHCVNLIAKIVSFSYLLHLCIIFGYAMWKHKKYMYMSFSLCTIKH